MDGIANVARQQQSQVSSTESQGRAVEQSLKTAQTQPKQQDTVKSIQQDLKNADNQVKTKEDVQDLVKELNKALGPISTSLKFGVDSQDVFYVSVIESQTNKMIRRFPAEQAHDFLPKMQEVSGILFDTKG